MKATDVRIGNYHYYHMVDEMDWRKEWMELSIIDCEDFRLLSNHPDDNNYHPIPISEEELLKLGFQEGYTKNFYWNNVFGIKKIKDEYHFIIGGKHVHIQYVHQLQNLFFAITEKELIYRP